MEIGGGELFVPHPTRRVRALVVGCGTLQRSCCCRCGEHPCLFFVTALAKCSLDQAAHYCTYSTTPATASNARRAHTRHCGMRRLSRSDRTPVRLTTTSDQKLDLDTDST